MVCRSPAGSTRSPQPGRDNWRASGEYPGCVSNDRPGSWHARSPWIQDNGDWGCGLKRTSLIKRLVKLGCYLKRHGNKHDIYANPHNGKQTPVQDIKRSKNPWLNWYWSNWVLTIIIKPHHDAHACVGSKRNYPRNTRKDTESFFLFSAFPWIPWEIS